MDQPDLSFESLKKFNLNDVEYWSARDLQPCLGYSQWRDFKNAVKKAMKSCEQSGNSPTHHFADARKPILGGKGATQMVEDYNLSRFACYLIAQNGDPRKPEIALAQKEQLMDRMDTTELAANLFRMTQTKEKLKNERIKNQRDAMEVHEAVGKKVRSTIEEIGGTLPENIPPAEPINHVKKRLKTAQPRLALDPKDAAGIGNYAESSENH